MTVVVTGATGGLGRCCAHELAAAGRQVVLAVRDVARGEQVAAGIRRATGNDGVDVVALDLASLHSVGSAAAELRERPLEAIVANAGVQVLSSDHATSDGFELTFGVNHLAHFLLIRLLLDALAPGGRVVIVASGTHFGTWRENGGMIPAPRWRDPRELARPRAGDGREAYSTSKLANVLCALELARRTPTHQATATAFDPGLMPGTELARDAGPVARWAWKNVMPALTRLPGPISSAQRSGVHLARLVTDPALAGVTGRYVAQGRPKPPSAQAQDPVLAADLWRASDELVGLPAQ